MALYSQNSPLLLKEGPGVVLSQLWRVLHATFSYIEAVEKPRFIFLTRIETKNFTAINKMTFYSINLETIYKRIK
jgi:hypothetical protein